MTEKERSKLAEFSCEYSSVARAITEHRKLYRELCQESDRVHAELRKLEAKREKLFLDFDIVLYEMSRAKIKTSRTMERKISNANDETN